MAKQRLSELLALQRQAATMWAALDRTNQTVAATSTLGPWGEVRLWLRLSEDGRQVQLMTSTWTRQTNQEERAMLRHAFGVPEETEDRLSYVKGWGVMRITWGRPHYQQETLFSQAEQVKHNYGGQR